MYRRWTPAGPVTLAAVDAALSTLRRTPRESAMPWSSSVGGAGLLVFAFWILPLLGVGTPVLDRAEPGMSIPDSAPATVATTAVAAVPGTRRPGGFRAVAVAGATAGGRRTASAAVSVDARPTGPAPTPAMSLEVDQPSDPRGSRLLALIATICVFGVTTAILRAILAQRTAGTLRTKQHE